MALAVLLRRMLAPTLAAKTTRVHAFIVDHSVRLGSDTEAAKVGDAMRAHGFTPVILTLNWGPDGPPTHGFETAARTARYQALAKACVERQVKHLLLGHHQDDIVETVMMRMINSSKAEGLRGMRMTSKIPESWGIFHAENVQLGRPLLTFPKVDRLLLGDADRAT